MLFSVAQLAAGIDAAFNIHCTTSVHIPLLVVPSQQIKPMLTDAACDARARWMTSQRTDLGDMTSLDRQVLRSAVAKSDPDQMSMLTQHLTLARWDNDKLFAAGFVDAPYCELCATPATDREPAIHIRQTTHHLLYDCEALTSQRQQAIAKHLEHVCEWRFGIVANTRGA